MRTDKQFFKCIALAALLGTGFATAGIAQETTTIVDPETKAPAILTTTPTDSEMNVDLNSSIEITFNSEMDETTINETTLLLHATSADSMTEEHGEMMDDQINDRSAINDSENSWPETAVAINGTISYSNKVAVFTPEMELKEGTQYTFTVTHGVENLENIALENDHTWSFKTTGSSDSTYADMQDDRYSMDRNDNSENTSDTTDTNTIDSTSSTDSMDSLDTTLNSQNKMIDLGKAGQFVILAKTSVIKNSASKITGHIGEGSVADSLKKETVDTASTQSTTTGMAAVMQSNQSDTTTPDISEALEDMMTAFSDVSTQNGSDSTMDNEEDSTSQTNDSFNENELTSGIHEWSDSLNIESDITLAGGVDDVWVFRVGDNLTVDENTVITLTGGARAENIFWYVEGQVTIGSDASFEGIILSMDEITLEKGAKLSGRMFSQTSISLDDNIVTEPGNMTGQRTSTNR